MRRKILRVGKSSLAISIPKDYVDRHGLKTGEEIIVDVKGTSLIIKKEKRNTLTEKTIDLSRITTNYDDFLGLLKTNELTKEKIAALIDRDSLINDYSDICKRIINKTITDYKSTEQYVFIDRLEK